jgi:Trypsin
MDSLVGGHIFVVGPINTAWTQVSVKNERYEVYVNDIARSTQLSRALSLYRLLAISLLIVLLTAAVADAESLADSQNSEASAGVQAIQIANLESRLGLDSVAAARAIAVENSVGELPATIEEALGDSYAGTWFDPWHGTFDIGIASSTEQAVPTVRHLLAEQGIESTTAFVRVRSTFPELAQAKEVWTERLAPLMEKKEAGTAIDPFHNAVVLEISDALSGDERKVLAQEAEASSVNVRVEDVPVAQLDIRPTLKALSTCAFKESTYDYCDKPLQAGTEIHSSVVNGYVNVCTSAFFASSILPEQYPDHYLLTAAHCFDGGEGKYATHVWYSANHNQEDHAIGHLGYRYENANGDAAFIDLDSEKAFWEDGGLAWFPWVFTPGAKWGPPEAPEAYKINIVGTNEPPNVQYQTPCHSGYGSGVRCGVTEYVGVSEVIEYDEGNKTIGNLVQNSACSRGGDSGGPWIFNNYAMGIEVASVGGCPGGPSWFDDLHTADHLMGMKVRGFEGTIE